jgi:hypothetical protein
VLLEAEKNMVDPTHIVELNLNQISLQSWIDCRPRADGSYDLIGMSRRTERDWRSGEVISDVVRPTGVVGWAPRWAPPWMPA